MGNTNSDFAKLMEILSGENPQVNFLTDYSLRLLAAFTNELQVDDT